MDLSDPTKPDEFKVEVLVVDDDRNCEYCGDPLSLLVETTDVSDITTGSCPICFFSDMLVGGIILSKQLFQPEGSPS